MEKPKARKTRGIEKGVVQKIFLKHRNLDVPQKNFLKFGAKHQADHFCNIGMLCQKNFGRNHVIPLFPLFLGPFRHFSSVFGSGSSLQLRALLAAPSTHHTPTSMKPVQPKSVTSITDTTVFTLHTVPSVSTRSSTRVAKRKKAAPSRGTMASLPLPPRTPRKKLKKNKDGPKRKKKVEPEKMPDSEPEPENTCVTCGVSIPHTAQVCSFDCCSGSPFCDDDEFNGFVPSTPPPLRRSVTDFSTQPEPPAKLSNLGGVIDLVNKLDDVAKLVGDQQKEISRLSGVCQGLTRDISNLIGDIQRASNESSQDMWKEYDRVSFSTDRKLSVLEDTFRENVQKLEEKILEIDKRTVVIGDVINETFRDAESYTNQVADDTIKKIVDHIDQETHDIITQTKDQMLSPADVRAIIKEYCNSPPSPTWSDGDNTEVPVSVETGQKSGW